MVGARIPFRLSQDGTGESDSAWDVLEPRSLSAFCPCPGADRSQSAPRSSAERAHFIGINWEGPVPLPPLGSLENH
jgi:hypothetical protein